MLFTEWQVFIDRMLVKQWMGIYLNKVYEFDFVKYND